MKVGSSLFIAAILIVTMLMCGCVNVKAPERVDVGWDDAYAGPDDRSTDSGRTADQNARLRKSLKETQKDLDRARDRIDDLEEELDDCRKNLKKAQNQRDQYERERDRYKNALED